MRQQGFRSEGEINRIARVWQPDGLGHDGQGMGIYLKAAIHELFFFGREGGIARAADQFNELIGVCVRIISQGGERRSQRHGGIFRSGHGGIVGVQLGQRGGVTGCANGL